MKRWLWYAAALALILAVSAESYRGNDVGELRPVQTVRILVRDGVKVIETDSGELGEGETLQDAFADMEATSPARIFLDTAEYLLITPDCKDLLPELMDYLRPSCCLCLIEGEADLEQVGRFLQIHVPDLTLMDFRAGMDEIPLLRTVNGRMELVR